MYLDGDIFHQLKDIHMDTFQSLDPQLSNLSTTATYEAIRHLSHVALSFSDSTTPFRSFSKRDFNTYNGYDPTRNLIFFTRISNFG